MERRRLYKARTDFAVPPGETLAEFLETKHMRKRDLAYDLGMSIENTVALIKGELPVTTEIASKLETVTGISAGMWQRLETNYRSTVSGPQQ